MPKAEVGSTKYLANKMKQKGLQRLRWYCQVCERQMRDQNAFKQHTMSESHVRQMLAVGENTEKWLNDYSDQFLKDFIQLLKTGHGEKQIQINRIYQEYIANKEHIHMNATKWPSLTEFAKYLSREGICRVEENEKGIHISWIDNSPEALRRQEALRRKDAQDRGNEEVEQMMIREQIKRAQSAAGTKDVKADGEVEKDRELRREDGEKIKLSFGAKPSKKEAGPSTASAPSSSLPAETASPAPATTGTDKESTAKPSAGISLKMTAKPPTKNVFAQAKKNALAGGGAKKSAFDQGKKMTEAERIMREEMERAEKKRSRGSDGFGGGAFSKKQKTDK